MIHLKIVKDNVVEYIHEQNIATPKQDTEWIRPIVIDTNKVQVIVCVMDTKANFYRKNF